MEPIATVRRVAILLLLGGSAGFAQSSLPAISPTAATIAPTSTAMSPPNATKVEYPAQVAYVGGKLEVNADNSSLNQILRDIACATGMKITGGVVDERVYGKYGPSSPSEILANLLDGTNSNMMLRESAAKAPMELILTPREGGPTPPSPNAAGGYSDDEVRQQAGRPPFGQPAFGQTGPAGQAPTQSAPAVMSSDPVLQPGNVPPRAPYMPGTTQSPRGNYPQSPNGVMTPQQIYQQLQQLQRTQPQP